LKSHSKASIPASRRIEINKPGDYVFIDHLGPLPASQHRFKYILVIYDGFSRLVKLYPCRKVGSKEVLIHTKDYVEKVGKINHLISDNATGFSSKAYYREMSKLGIDAGHISPYNPQANLAERVIGRVGNMLRLRIAGMSHNRWFEHLQTIESIINRMEHTVTLSTPWELHFGEPIQDELSEILHLPKSSINIQEKMELAIRRTKEQACRKDLRAKKPTVINIGDLVKIKGHEQSDKAKIYSAKLTWKFRVPYRVIAKTNDNQYKLKCLITDGVEDEVQNIRNIVRLPDIMQDIPNDPRFRRWKSHQLTIDDQYRKEVSSQLPIVRFKDPQENYRIQKILKPAKKGRLSAPAAKKSVDDLRRAFEHVERSTGYRRSPRLMKLASVVGSVSADLYRHENHIDSSPDLEEEIENFRIEIGKKLLHFWKNSQTKVSVREKEDASSEFDKILPDNTRMYLKRLVVYIDGACIGNGSLSRDQSRPKRANSNLLSRCSGELVNLFFFEVLRSYPIDLTALLIDFLPND
jgi:hypothetical protein